MNLSSVKNKEKIEALHIETRQWPTSPGIYIMRDSQRKILYVGKAKNLKNRITSYFSNPLSIQGKNRVLIQKVFQLEFTITHNELEALLLECTLIKKHKPPYNIRLKDDKSFPYITLDFSHPYPQFSVTRKVSHAPHLRYFGPYTSSIKEISRFLLKTFQIRDCSDYKFSQRTRPCLNYEIGTCTAPCVSFVDQTAYAKQVQQALLFLTGKNRQLLIELQKEMSLFSKKLQFEKAKLRRDQIQAIQKMSEKQGTILLQQQKDIDVFHYFQSENRILWITLFIRSGRITGRKATQLQVPTAPKSEKLNFESDWTCSFLEQYYLSALLPQEIWLAQDFEGRKELATLFSEKALHPVQILVKRQEIPLRILGMAYENAKLLLEQNLSSALKDTEKTASTELQQILELPHRPKIIEGMDVSNLQGTSPSVALVQFFEEKPKKENYRVYHPVTTAITQIDKQDDFAMIYQTVLRRYENGKNPLPDLLVIDGGKGQLYAAFKAIQELQLSLPLCALAKERTVSDFSRAEITKSKERIFLLGRKNPVLLKETSKALQLLQQIRNEAHRFSVKHHQIRRKNSFFHTPHSVFSTKGIGEKSRQLLLRHFGSIEAIQKATKEELIQAGLSSRVAEALFQKLRS